MEANQLDLFANAPILKSASRPKSLSMDAAALVEWKAKVASHQQHAKAHQVVQGNLFDVSRAHVDPDKIDPFSLSPCPLSFYRLPTDSPGEACIYFVLDSAASLVLYYRRDKQKQQAMERNP